jgi:predicted Zn-dependent peptidase
VPNNCVLAIYGDVKTAEVRAPVEGICQLAWESRPEKPAGVSRECCPHRAKRVREARDKKQAVLVIGFPAPRWTAMTGTRWN